MDNFLESSISILVLFLCIFNEFFKFIVFLILHLNFELFLIFDLIFVDIGNELELIEFVFTI